MAHEDREQTQDLLDKAEYSAVQKLQQQLTDADPKVVNKAANDLIGIRLKQAPGAGGPVLNLHFGQISQGMKKVKEAGDAPAVEVLEEGR